MNALLIVMSIYSYKVTGGGLTKSSTSSLIAVMNNTMTKGTNVVYLEVGEIPGICYMIFFLSIFAYQVCQYKHYLDTGNE